MSHAHLSPMDALKRSNTAPSIVVVGPSTSGKSKLVYSLVNDGIFGSISKGIGEKSQTTIIPCNFAFDSRIAKDDQFALRIRKKIFDYKAVSIVIQESLCQLFCNNDMDAEDTIDSIDDDWIDSVLEPSDASYHLKTMKDVINTQSLKDSLNTILNAIQSTESSFADRITAKRQESHKLKPAQIRNIVFEEVWNSIDDSLKKDFFKWLVDIGTVIGNKLDTLFGEQIEGDGIKEFSVNTNDEFPCAVEILNNLFDPMQAYSLVINEMTLACKPRKELAPQTDDEEILRFCLRDTMGLTQVGMDNVSIKNALDIALNCNPDSILLLFNLEERDDVLSDSFKAITEKLPRITKRGIPINVLFTKADKIIENKVIRITENKIITQKDYDSVKDIIEELDSDIEKYLEQLKIPRESADWLSLVYRDKDIDPIQKALDGDDLAMHFKPEGLYKKIGDIIKGAQHKILPAGIKRPIYVTVNDPEKPAMEIKLDKVALANTISKIQNMLTKNTATVNGYKISTTHRFSGRSVVAYWNKLQIGIGHTTRAYVYGNFSINMKGMLNRVLIQHITKLVDFYQIQADHTIIDNLKGGEPKNLVNKLDIDGRFNKIAFDGINPESLKRMSNEMKNKQIFHAIFKEYFEESGKHYIVMDKVAFQLSYGNEEIKTRLTKIYNSSADYDSAMRKLQGAFFALFESTEFAQIVIQEIEKAMTDLICKMVIAI